MSVYAPSALAASPEPSCAAWLEKQWSDAAQAELPFSNVEVVFSIEFRDAPGGAEMARLRQEVPGHPEHPRKNDLKLYERRLAGIPYIQRWRVFFGTHGNWRSCYDMIDGENKSYLDISVTPKHAWGMGAKQLTLVDPARGYPPEYPYSTEEDVFGTSLKLMTEGGFHLAMIPGLERQTPRLRGDAWQMRAATKDGALAVEYKGAWDSSSGTGRIDSMLIERCDSMPGEVGQLTEFTDWRLEPTLGRSVAATVRETSPLEPQRNRVIRFESASAITAARLREVTAVPAADRPDPVRGATTFTGVHDFTGGEIMIAAKTPDGWRHIAEAQTPQRRQERSTRYLGWVLACSLGFMLAALMIRRKSRARVVRPAA